jgi:hypothetical protein
LPSLQKIDHPFARAYIEHIHNKDLDNSYFVFSIEDTTLRFKLYLKGKSITVWESNNTDELVMNVFDTLKIIASTAHGYKTKVTMVYDDRGTHIGKILMDFVESVYYVISRKAANDISYFVPV